VAEEAIPGRSHDPTRGDQRIVYTDSRRNLGLELIPIMNE
jgi:hypothetical protein